MPPRRKSSTTSLLFMVVLLAAPFAVFFTSMQPMASLEDGADIVEIRPKRIERGDSSSSSEALTGTATKTTIAAQKPEPFTSVNKADGESDTASKAIVYPLRSLNISSAQGAYEGGFWQRAEPVPLDRWDATANTTCVPLTKQQQHIMPEWKRRVPHVIMIGAQKAGTTALSYYLYNHPAVQYFPAKELHYFDEDLDQNPTIIINGSGIPAAKVLDYYQETVIGGAVPLVKFETEVKYALDATPNYMFLSDRVPHRILCTTPWVKLLAILRDPVDRAYSQYHMQFHRDLLKPEIRRGDASFEDFIALDMKVLQDAGVVPRGYGGWYQEDTKNNDMPTTVDAAYFMSEKVLQGWATYTKLGLNSPVGRGLYALQLQQWFETMDLYNKPRSDLRILPSHRLLNSPNETYAEILDFLELQPHSLAKYSKIHKTTYRTPDMAPEIRTKLQAFYKPFNRHLRDLLSSEKGWDGIWDTNE